MATKKDTKNAASGDEEKPKKDTTPHKPTEKTRELVKTLAVMGTKQAKISSLVGVDEKTLRKYYRSELDDSMLQAHSEVANFLFQMASGRALKKESQIAGAKVKDCVLAAIFYAKTQMNWSEGDGDEDEKGGNITLNFHRGMKPSGT